MALDDYPRWPTYAIDPPPLNEGYEIQFPDLMIRTDFEQGPARQRQVFRSGPTGFSLSMALTTKQFVLWKGWYKLFAEGGQWFVIPVFTGDDYEDLVIRIRKGTLKAVRDGGEWLISFVYETMDSITPTDSETAVLMLTWGTDTSAGDLADSFRAAVHGLHLDMNSMFT